MYGYGQRSPHEDSGDIELCIKVARQRLAYGLTDGEVHAELVRRGVNSGMAHLAIVAAKTLNKDAE